MWYWQQIKRPGEPDWQITGVTCNEQTAYNPGSIMYMIRNGYEYKVETTTLGFDLEEEDIVTRHIFRTEADVKRLYEID